MTKLPFYIGMFLSCFVKKAHDRHVLRGRVNCFLYRPQIARFIKDAYGEKLVSVKFVRQNTPRRCVCLVNDKYYVKIFKDMKAQKMRDFAFLVNYIRDFISTPIPRVYVAKNNHMYATEKLSGKSIYDFDKDYVFANEDKIIKNVKEIIRQMQAIDLSKIPNYEKYKYALETTAKEIKSEEHITKDSVLTHFDTNEKNFLFDDDLNICGFIDFDSLALSNDKNKDWEIFDKYWQKYKRRIERLQKTTR